MLVARGRVKLEAEIGDGKPLLKMNFQDDLYFWVNRAWSGAWSRLHEERDDSSSTGSDDVEAAEPRTPLLQLPAPAEQPIATTAAPSDAAAGVSNTAAAPAPASGASTAEPVTETADSELFESDCLLWKATQLTAICVGVPWLTGVGYALKTYEQAAELKRKLLW